MNENRAASVALVREVNDKFEGRVAKLEQSEKGDSGADATGLAQALSVILQQIDRRFEESDAKDEQQEALREAQLLNKVEAFMTNVVTQIAKQADQDRKAMLAMMQECMKPKQKTGVIDLPEGPVTITITES